MIKSPLRYPGGKSRAITDIVRVIPYSFNEYREPFVGGGSLFIYIRQTHPHVKVWVNDLNVELFLFWRELQLNAHKLAQCLIETRKNVESGAILFQQLTQQDTSQMTDFERAIRFFILNRITFSGTVESGGYSEQAFHGRFTHSSIDRLLKMGKIMDGVKITNLDYAEVMDTEGKDVFIFLDPPYLSATQSRLYGKNGSLHLIFDHARFKNHVLNCAHACLITYDDSPAIRQLYAGMHQQAWKLQYGMNNYKQESAEIGNELFIANYDMSAEDKNPQQLTLLERKRKYE
jgi:DNA adenine methylase